MFKVNDYVKYKNDVCVISNIKEIRGFNYYTLAPIQDTSLIVNLPVDTNLVKPLIEYNDAIKMIDDLPNLSVLNMTNDKALEQSYRKLLLSDETIDLFTIVKTAFLRNKKRNDSGRKLGSVDTHYYEEASKKLLLELSIVMHLDEDKIENILIEQITK